MFKTLRSVLRFRPIELDAVTRRLSSAANTGRPSPAGRSTLAGSSAASQPRVTASNGSPAK